jgi:hypothetical protein
MPLLSIIIIVAMVIVRVGWRLLRQRGRSPTGAP